MLVVVLLLLSAAAASPSRCCCASAALFFFSRCCCCGAGGGRSGTAVPQAAGAPLNLLRWSFCSRSSSSSNERADLLYIWCACSILVLACLRPRAAAVYCCCSPAAELLPLLLLRLSRPPSSLLSSLYKGNCCYSFFYSCRPTGTTLLALSPRFSLSNGLILHSDLSVVSAAAAAVHH